MDRILDPKTQNNQNYILDCTYKYGEWGYFANSSEEYFEEMKGRGEYSRVNKMLEHVDVWDNEARNWSRLYDRHMNPETIDQTFR